MAVVTPERPQSRTQPRCDFNVALLQGPLQCRTEIIVLRLQTREPRELLPALQPCRPLLSQREGIRPVVPAHGIRLSAGRQALRRVLADRFQHGEARLTSGAVLLPEQAL